MTEMIMSLATNHIYEIEINRNAENYSVCPECSKNRRKTKSSVSPTTQKKKSATATTARRDL